MQQLFADHHAWALRVARGVIGDTHDAEDVVSDVFLAVHKAKLNGGGPTGNVRAYLRRAIQNEATRIWARKRFEEVTEEVPDEATIDPAEALLRALSRQKELAKHPPSYTLVLYGQDVLGEPIDVTAERLNLSVSATKSLLHRARSALKRAA